MELLQTRVDANGLTEVMDLTPPTSDVRGTCTAGKLKGKLAHAGPAGKFKGGVYPEVIAAAKQALRMRNDVQPYKFNAKSPGGSTIETFMFLPHEALRSLASGTALDQLCLPRDEVDTGHGLSVLLRRWAQDPAVDCDATQAAEAVAR